MKRQIILALLLFTSPASAGRGMLVEMNGAQAQSGAISEKIACVYRSSLGMDVDKFPVSALKTLWVVNAQYRGPEGVKTYDYIIVHNYREGAGGGGANGANIDSIWRDPGTGNPRWPVVPMLIVSDQAFVSNNQLGPPTVGTPPMDSIGFAGNSTSALASYQTRVQYSPELQRGWHTLGGGSHYARLDGPGVNRDILLDKTGPWWSYRQLLPGGIGGGWSTPDWDSVSTGASDSVLIRARYRATASGNGTGPPVVVAVLWSGGVLWQQIRLVVTSLAVIDSASGGRVLFQTRPGPVTFCVQSATVGATGRYDATDAQGLANDFGVFMPAGVDSDGPGWRSTIDALANRGVRMTFGVQTNPDSVAVYGNQIAYVANHMPNAKFYPFERAGLGDYSTTFSGVDAAGGNADATHNYDGFGAMRQRSLLPAGCADPRLGCDCSTDTTSLLCLLLRQKQALAALVGASRIDNVWSAPAEDYTPRYFGRSTGSIDSLVWVLYRFVGLRGLRTGNIAVMNLAGDVTANSPRGWFRNQAALLVRDPATREVIGRFAFIPSRDAESSAPVMAQVSAHDNASEFLGGLFAGNWYDGIPNPIYQGDGRHDFYNRPMIFEVPMNWMGGSGDPRYEWHVGLNLIADFDDFCKLVNRLGGREIVRMGYGDETASWFIRSGLR